MNIKKYSLRAAVSKSVESVGVFYKLIKGEYATSVLPADTKFAVVMEAIEKNFSESFSEVSANVLSRTINYTTEGSVGRFLGYLAFTDNKMRFYRALDEDITKQNNPVQVNVIAQNQDVHLIYECDISALSGILDSGQYVITDGIKKFKLISAYPISKIEGKFESKIGGTQNGLKPIFNYINLHGGNVKFSNVGSVFTLIIIIVFIVLVLLFIKNK